MYINCSIYDVHELNDGQCTVHYYLIYYVLQLNDGQCILSI